MPICKPQMKALCQPQKWGYSTISFRIVLLSVKQTNLSSSPSSLLAPFRFQN